MNNENETNKYNDELSNLENLKNLKFNNDEIQNIMKDLNVITNMFLKKIKSSADLFDNKEEYIKTIYRIAILIGYYASENNLSFIAIVSIVRLLGDMAKDRYMGFLSAIQEGMNY